MLGFLSLIVFRFLPRAWILLNTDVVAVEGLLWGSASASQRAFRAYFCQKVEDRK
jgi:hypothetical protein